jgi:hypothetical protein
MLGSKTLRHLSQHFCSFDPEPERQLRPNIYHREYVPHPLAGCLRMLTTYPCVDAGFQSIMPSGRPLFLRSTWNQRGYSTPILATVHLYRVLQLGVFVFCPFTVRSAVKAMLGFKESCHLFQHCFCVRPGTSAATATQSLSLCVLQHPSACCFRLLLIYPCVHSPCRCWDPRQATAAPICFVLTGVLLLGGIRNCTS